MAPLISNLRFRITQSPASILMPASSYGSVPSARPKPRLLEWSELPQWQRQDNNHVQTGYRIATPSFLRCLAAWKYLHNENVNIYSHLFGALVFYVLGSQFYIQLLARHASALPADTAVFSIYLFGVAGCYTLSVLFHTLMSHSPDGCRFGIKLDFQGIILLIWSAAVPLIHYTFIHERKLASVYWILISVSGVLASIITFTPAFHKPATKLLRAGVFGSLALSTLAAVIHGLSLHGWAEQSHRFPMWSISGTLFFNVLGATAYVFRFPEKWYPRTFDIFGASHQVMHVAIFIASLWWLAGMIKAFDNVHAEQYLLV